MKAYPKAKASTNARAMLAPFGQPHHVANTNPSTSPIAQPVRQWSVAVMAMRVSGLNPMASPI